MAAADDCEKFSTRDGLRWEVFWQTPDQDLWVVGDRSREEGVPSRFGRGTGMCPLIRLGNCGGRERVWELARRGWRLYESCFPVRNCSIVSAQVSCFSFFLIHCASSFSSRSPLPPQQKEKSTFLCTKNPVCVCMEGGVAYMCVCFTNEEQLSNQSTLFRLAPLGSNRKYSQDFLSLSQALKQDTSAGPAY